MIVYHGTSSQRGNAILNDGVLKKDAHKVYSKDHLFPTTDDYIYVTNDLINAIYYGNKTVFNDNKFDEIFIFSIELDEAILLPDLDEIKYTLEPFEAINGIKDINNPTLQESLTYALSARIGQDIDLKKYNVKYTKVASSFLGGNIEEALETKEVIALINKNNYYAEKYKQKFISKLKWEHY